MKTQNSFAKKALTAIIVGGAMLGSQSLFNEVQACDGECPGPYNKNYHYEYYGGTVHGVCDGVGNNCKTCRP